jgi:acetyl-CoA C-acetyltransferase
VNRHCTSGQAAIQIAAADIRAGMTRAAIAGGAESMTSSPQTFKKQPFPYGGVEPWISPSHPDSPEAPNMNMGITVGENTAEIAGVTRADQDAWALGSHQKAVAAQQAGRFADELVAVEVPDGQGGTRIVDADDGPRPDTSMNKLARLPAIFKRDGTVTAGNSSPINDGSAAVVLADSDYAEERGLAPLAIVRSWATVGVEPRRTGLAPTVAVPKALQRAGLELDHVDLVEIHEAFASMAVACTRELGFDPDIVNVNGGGVALGHPVGCSGTRIVVTLLHELQRRGGGIGVATMCAGGGMAGATVIEVPAA